jgi:DNA-binding Lrp family transcriptional regulator
MALKQKAQEEASGGPIKAYVLIQTLPGKVESVLRFVRRMPEVRLADSVTGPYDIVVVLEVEEVRELASVVAGTMGGLRGVTHTTTLLATS